MKIPTIKSYFDALLEGKIKITGSRKQHFAKWLDENGLYTHKRAANISLYESQANKRQGK